LLRAREEIEAALVRYRAARTRVERIQDAASSSKRAAELAHMRFSDGLGDLLDVLEAERTQLEAEDQSAQARTEAATTYAALYKALGGVWPIPGNDVAR
jgi:outer membrane protein TolC